VFVLAALARQRILNASKERIFHLNEPARTAQ